MFGEPLPAWRQVAQALLALALARAEFAGVELSMSVQAALRWLLLAMASGVVALLALCGLSATLVVALWQTWGWYPLAALTVFYCAGTVLMAAWLLRAVARARPLLSDTLAELAKDVAALRRSADAAAAAADERT